MPPHRRRGALRDGPRQRCRRPPPARHRPRRSRCRQVAPAPPRRVSGPNPSSPDRSGPAISPGVAPSARQRDIDAEHRPLRQRARRLLGPHAGRPAAVRPGARPAPRRGSGPAAAPARPARRTAQAGRGRAHGRRQAARSGSNTSAGTAPPAVADQNTVPGSAPPALRPAPRPTDPQRRAAAKTRRERGRAEYGPSPAN